MASAAEQLAANFNFGSFAKASELKKRIWFTLGALIVYRLGTYIPVPGIDPRVLSELFSSNSGGILGMFDMFSGGAVSRMTVFALNIMPYISASIIIQLVTPMIPTLEQLKKDGESGRKKINQYTRYFTIILAMFQAYGLAVAMQSIKSATGVPAVPIPGSGFIMVTIITLVTGTAFLMWLGEQITSRGIGNGISLLIFSGIVAGLPRSFASTLDLARTGAISTITLLLVLVLVVAVIAFIVFMERAHRKVIVQYPKRQVGLKMFEGQSSHMPLKLNTSGVIPPIFASSLLSLPLLYFSLAGQKSSDFAGTVTHLLSHGQPLYMLLFGALIVFFCFFYTSIMFNPDETSDNLRKNGGFIPGIRPGKSTSEYFDYVLTRLTVIGSAYLVLICLLPEFVIAKLHMPFYLGGTSILIVVSVTMDTVAQIHGHLMAHQYEGLIKKAKLRGKR